MVPTDRFTLLVRSIPRPRRPTEVWRERLAIAAAATVIVVMVGFFQAVGTMLHLVLFGAP